MNMKRIQVHYAVCVPIDIEVDDNGNTAEILYVGTPYIDPELNINYGCGDTWEEEAEEWRSSTEAEYDAGTARIGVFANNGESDTVLDEIARLLDDPEDSDLTLLGRISGIVDRARARRGA